MKILTLCDKCQMLYSHSYNIRPYTLNNPTTEVAPKCDHCHKPYRAQLKLYIVERKGR